MPCRARHGHLDISDPKGGFEPKRVRVLRAHLEEDAGKSLHDEVAGKGDTLIDLNRTGTPLLEIVSEPDMRCPLEAKAFLTELKLLLTYIGVSDCNMLGFSSDGSRVGRRMYQRLTQCRTRHDRRNACCCRPI